MSSSIRASGSRSRPPASCCNSSNRPRPNCWPRPGRWAKRSRRALRGGLPPPPKLAFSDVGRDYFSAKATLAQQAGALLCLYDAPHYFRRAGKGRFRKATADILRQALAAIEKKKAVQQQIGDWA